MWDGALERAVWTAAVVGVAWLTLASAPAAARGSARSARAPLDRRALTAVALAAAWATVRPRVPAGDEPHYLVITQSLLRDGDLRIENNHREDQYLEYYEGVLKPDFMQRGTDGEIYSIHAPGIAALVAPAFRLSGYPGAVATVIAPVALGLAAAWQAAFLVTGSMTAAWIGWLAIATSAPFLLHGFTIYPDPAGATAGDGRRAGARLAWRSRRIAAGRRSGWHRRRAGPAAVAPHAVRRCGGRARPGAVVRLCAVPGDGAMRRGCSACRPPRPWRGSRTSGPSMARRTRRRLMAARPDWAVALIPNGLAGLLADQQFGLAANAPVLLVALVGSAAGAPPAATGYRARPGRAAVPAERGDLPDVVGRLQRAGPLRGDRPAAAGRADWRICGASGLGRPRRDATLMAASAGISLALVGVDRGVFVFNGRDGYGAARLVEPHGRSHPGPAERAPRRGRRRDRRTSPSGSSPVCCWRRWQSCCTGRRRRAWARVLQRGRPRRPR